MKKLQTFRAIEGVKLNAVVFVEDYVQLQFDEVTITLGIFPVVSVNHADYRIGNELYRDKFCSQIDKLVEGTYIEDHDEELTIVFTDESKLVISRSDNSLELPELVVLEKKNEPIVVW
ncbi:MAG: hypothetical protein WBD16_06475 [Pyrinomonadaceae bacterium]